METAGGDLVILDATVGARRGVDIRVRLGKITEVAGGIHPDRAEVVIEAHGGEVIAGLRDHHIHLRALSAARHSVWLGPPSVRNAGDLAAVLRRAAADAGPRAWIRGIGYHESVAGPLDRAGLDALVADRPVRIQHRSGQLWMLNSAGIARIRGEGVDPRVDHPDGRFLHADRWLRDRLGPEAGPGPELAAVGRQLAAFGVTGVSDATVSNGPADAGLLQAALPQQVLVMGDDLLATGPRKVVLHDDGLPTLDELSGVIRAAHGQGRAVAIHCVTAPSLWLALIAFGEAGPATGDRIEHGSVIPPEAIAPLRGLGLTVVTQPNFVRERGDAYLEDVDPSDRPWLYRVAGLRDAGVAVAAGTDAPFGDPDPWLAMTAAVERRTLSGVLLGETERVTPEAALALFTGELTCPGQPRRVAAGAPADLCLLAVPWREARLELSHRLVVATVRAGRLIYGPVS